MDNPIDEFANPTLTKKTPSDLYLQILLMFMSRKTGLTFWETSLYLDLNKNPSCEQPKFLSF